MKHNGLCICLNEKFDLLLVFRRQQQKQVQLPTPDHPEEADIDVILDKVTKTMATLQPKPLLLIILANERSLTAVPILSCRAVSDVGIDLTDEG